MRAKLTFKNTVIAALIALLVIQFIIFAIVTRVNQNLKQQINGRQLSSQLIYNGVDDVSQQQSLSVLPKENRLYLPELNLTIPLNPITRSLRYNFNEGSLDSGSGNIRLTSSYMTDHQNHRLSCSDMVRLKIENKPDAYSPEQPLYATVSLADERKLNIYASTTKDCRQAWLMITPQKIAEQFKDAQSY